MAERESWRLDIGATNTGSAMSDTHRDALLLVVNGKESSNFRLNWGNGHRDKRWAALPVGESLSEGRQLGKVLFPSPGHYAVVLFHETTEVARGTVHVVDR